MTLPETSKALAADEVPAEKIARLLYERFAAPDAGRWPTGAAGAWRSLAREIIDIADRANRPPEPVSSRASDHASNVRKIAAWIAATRIQGWANPMASDLTEAADFIEGKSPHHGPFDVVLSSPEPVTVPRQGDAEAVRRETVEAAAERVIDILCNDPARDEAAADRAADAFNGRYKLASMSGRLSDLGRVLANEIRALLPAEKETER